jgi:hypothetical protein
VTVFTWTTDANGNMVITADQESRDDLRDLHARQENGDLSFPDIESRVFEELHLQEVRPEEIGALTSAPIVTDDVDRDDDGKLTRIGRVWWFPNYQVECLTETLQQRGTVRLTFAPKEESSATEKEEAR